MASTAASRSASGATTSPAASFVPFIRTVQKIVLYETKARFYVIGSNNGEKTFRVLKIDRTEPRLLSVSEDQTSYGPKEIRELLTMIDVGNRSKSGQKMGTGLVKSLSAFGIVGFVRFLEGYYMLLITKRRKAAMLGQHSIYKIEDTKLVYLPNEDTRDFQQEEQRYVKMFNAIDLSSNFYFSYSYDLTNTLQHNLADPSFVYCAHQGQDSYKKIDPRTMPRRVTYTSLTNERYLWNSFLTGPVRDRRICQEWILPIIHGFVDQAIISVYGIPVHLILIARRSNRFAGTRFLKRGANFDGDVANEVETEQVVATGGSSRLRDGHVTAFVQFRGSVPGHWSQQLMKAKPPIQIDLPDPYARASGRHFNYLLRKYGAPVIVLNLLKKTENSEERDRRREGSLSDEYRQQIEYLNMFVPKAVAIQYISFDMAKVNKKKGETVMYRLTEIADHAVKKTGIMCRTNIGGGLDGVSLKADQGARLQKGVVRTNCVDCLDRTNTAQFVVAKSALAMQLHQLGFIPEPRIDFDCDASRMLETMFEDHGDTLALQYGGSQLIHSIKSYRKESKWTSKASDIAQTVRRYYSNALTDADKQNTINVFLGAFQPRRGRLHLFDKEFTSDHYLHLRQLNHSKHVKDLLLNFGTRWVDRDLLNCLPNPLEERSKKCMSLIVFDPRDESCDLYQDCYRPLELTVASETFVFKEASHSVRDYMPNCCTSYSPFVIRDREVKRREDASNSSSRSTFAVQLFLSWPFRQNSDKKTNNGRASAIEGLKGTKLPGSQEAPLAVSGSAPSSAGSSSALAAAAAPSRSPSVYGSRSSVGPHSSDSETDESFADSDDFDLLSLDDGFDQDPGKTDDESSSSTPVTFSSLHSDMETFCGLHLNDPVGHDKELYQRYINMEQMASPNFSGNPASIRRDAVLPAPAILRRTTDYYYSGNSNPLAPVKSALNSSQSASLACAKADKALYDEYVRIGKTATPTLKEQDLLLYSAYVQKSCRA